MDGQIVRSSTLQYLLRADIDLTRPLYTFDFPPLAVSVAYAVYDVCSTANKHVDERRLEIAMQLLHEGANPDETHPLSGGLAHFIWHIVEISATNLDRVRWTNVGRLLSTFDLGRRDASGSSAIDYILGSNVFEWTTLLRTLDDRGVDIPWTDVSEIVMYFLRTFSPRTYTYVFTRRLGNNV